MASLRTARAVLWGIGFGLLLSACDDEPAPAVLGCLGCHEGIEQVHDPIAADECVICHGGNALTADKAQAHVTVPANWAEIRGSGLPPSPYGFIRDFAPDQLDQLDPAYLKFINPGDIRVVAQTCGQCHPDQASTMGKSVMSTNAGHYYPTLYLAGLIDEPKAVYASYGAKDDACDPSVPGTVCELPVLRPPSQAVIEAALDSDDPTDLKRVAYEHYLAKNCNTCHQAGFPRNNSPALYRSAGCSSCHVVYATSGVYEGGDPTIPKGVPVHPSKHRITTAIPAKQCATCHFQGGRIGLAFRGIRENGFGAAQTPPNAQAINETLYGHAPGYYLTDEDTTNDVDETPPDIHFERGMHCVDCHQGTDVHGDGRIYDNAKEQVDIRCEDCHGTPRAGISPDSHGDFRASGGRKIPNLSRKADGSIVLRGYVDGKDHPVLQIAAELNERGAGSKMHRAMAPNADDWSHADSLTCDTCHTSYTLQCVGCHVSYDLRFEQLDYQTGLLSPGLTRGSRKTFTLDQVLLGTAPDGRVQTVHASQQVQMSVVDAEGQVRLGERGADDKIRGHFRESRAAGQANNGFLPFFQHTTTNKPRTCSSCHRTDDTPEEWVRVRGVYGYGTGQFMLEGPNGQMVDALQFKDDQGRPITDWVYRGTGPVAEDVEGRAMDVIVQDEVAQ
jgi:hypothetical protein